jgi:hypothetical protein
MKSEKFGGVMTARIFAVLAAVFLVGAFALASLNAPDMPLAQALFMLNRTAVEALRAGIQAHAAPWLWDSVAVPLLLRPVWLLPASIGVICAGVSLTFTSQPTHRSRRRS